MSQQIREHADPPSGGSRGQALDSRPAAGLTGRAAILFMLAVFALGFFGAARLDSPVLAGAGYLTGVALAALCVRRSALMTVAVTPPLLFFCVLITVKAITATGNTFVSVATGTAIVLAQTAPWLLCGTILSLAVALSRSLLRRVAHKQPGDRPDRHR